MAKKNKQKIGPKARKNDIVTHNGSQWKVLDREFDTYRSQSFYLLKTGSGRNKIMKWARSDTFTV